MLVSLYNCIKMLKSRVLDTIHIEQSHYFVLRLLNHRNEVDEFLRANQRSRIWHLKYNLLCLLNCKNDMTSFGAVGNRWEGGEEGEMGIQIVKKQFLSFRKRFQKKFMTNVIFIAHTFG